LSRARSRRAPVDAEKRVDAIFAQVKAAADKTRDANETARKAGITFALSFAPNAEALDGSDGVDAPRRHRCAKVEVLNTT
jgi:hypothetical protein